ncbi:unnamed protein product [Symbiodinium sp. CCMP2592]|nr:unnamed protein product [Symbiodinium sp. CCMP2592]CAE7361486.1 unnamed protein product [Symbiodinium sp. CCMP2592]
MAAPSRAVPSSADDLVIEDVATLLTEFTNQTESEVMTASVIEILRAASTVGLLKGKPILQQLVVDLGDVNRRHRFENSSRQVPSGDSPPGVVDAVASGTDRPTQEVPLEVLDVEMVQSAPPSSAVSVAASGADDSDAMAVDSRSEQLDEARDPATVLPQFEDKVVLLQLEFPWLSVIDLFSRSHPWWEAVCRFCSVVPEEYGTIKGQKISTTVLARWNCLRREDRMKLLAYVDATAKDFHSDPSLFVSGLLHMKDKLPFKNVGAVVMSLPDLTTEKLMGTDRAVVQCVDAKKSLCRLVQPSVLPDRLLRNDVATIQRSLPKLVVEKMVEGLDVDSLSLLEDAILNHGGHLRNRAATLRQEDILKRQNARALVLPRCLGWLGLGELVGILLELFGTARWLGLLRRALLRAVRLRR